MKEDKIQDEFKTQYNKQRLKQQELFLNNQLKLDKANFNETKQYIKGGQRFHNQDEYNKIINMLQDEQFLPFQNQHELQKEKRQSQTDSLTLLDNENFEFPLQQFDFVDQLINQQQQVFKVFNNLQIDYIRTPYTTEYGNSLSNKDFEILIKKGTTSEIYHGYCLVRKINIAIKYQIYPIIQFLELKSQYEIQHFIYNLYPNLFLRIDLPVIINNIDNNMMSVVSKHELGLINLYQYSQNHKIDEYEIDLIYQQLFQQILLLHKNNIAHRDIKPQNIVFVKDKGWLLCDFEFSVKYLSENCVCDIKGTKCFLNPILQYQCNIQGAHVKQDLFYNDQYALGITLLVIKNQISNSNQVDQYITIETDPKIMFLLQKSQKGELYNSDWNFQINFKAPIIMNPVKIENPNFLTTQQLDSLVDTLIYFDHFESIKEKDNFQNQLIKIIDQNLNSKRDDFFLLNRWIYERLFYYLPQYFYIEEHQFLEKIVQQVQNRRQFQGYVLIYESSWHIRVNIILWQIISQLKLQYFYSLLYEFEQVEQEYQQMIKIKELQDISTDDQSEFVNTTLALFNWNIIHEADLNYTSQFIGTWHLVSEDQQFFLNHLDSCDLVTKLINNFNEAAYFFRQNQGNQKFKHGRTLLAKAINQINLKDLIELDNYITNQLKYCSMIICYQQLLKQSLYFKFLYNNQISHYYKNFNFALIFQAQNQSVRIILDMIKLSAKLIKKMKKQAKLQNKIQKIYKLCLQYEDLKYNVHKRFFFNELANILDDQINQNNINPSFFHIIISWISKKLKQINKYAGSQLSTYMYEKLLTILIILKNRRKHDQLVSYISQIKGQKRNRQVYEIYYTERFTLHHLLEMNQEQKLTDQFLLNQYLVK